MLTLDTITIASCGGKFKFQDSQTIRGEEYSNFVSLGTWEYPEQESEKGPGFTLAKCFWASSPQRARVAPTS